MKIATFDIGSNTVRLLLGSVVKGQLHRDVVFREITRLSGGFRDGVANAESIARTIEAIREYARRARAFEAVEIRAVCTGVARRLNNPIDFLEEIGEITGLDAHIIDGKVEACISSLGAANEIGMNDQRFVLMDIGGFSTEIALIEQGKLKHAVSLEVGAVNQTEKHFRDDPPTMQQVDFCREEVHTVLADGVLFQDFEEAQILVGTAGTVTTLAAMDLKMERYEPYRLNRRILTEETIQALLKKMLAMPAQERLSIAGLEKGREDLMPAGAIISLEVMRIFGQEKMMVTEGGVLEGLALWEYWPPIDLSVDQSPG